MTKFLCNLLTASSFPPADEKWIFKIMIRSKHLRSESAVLPHTKYKFVQVFVCCYAAEIYNANGFDIALVQRLLQHSSASTTQRYIGIEPQKIEQAIQNHAQLI